MLIILNHELYVYKVAEDERVVIELKFLTVHHKISLTKSPALVSGPYVKP